MAEDCTKDGTCTHHEAEMARRLSDRTRISDLQEDIKGNSNHVGELLTFMNMCKGLGILGSVVVLGSYMYTYTHIVSSEAHIYQNKRGVEDLDKEMDELKVQVAVSRANYSSLADKLDTQNDRLSKLIDIINEERQARFDRIRRGIADPALREDDG